MKKFNRLIICTLFLSFYILNSINVESCDPNNCPKGINRSAFYTEVSVGYPFRLKDQQNTSCGVPGFDLYCDETLGTLIQLPNNLVFRVDDISYYNERITLSDPNKCLPRKLMSLNLTNTPFIDLDIKDFWLYNCSGDAYSFGYDRIDCLSGSNYTVISSRKYISSFDTNCSFEMILSVPVYEYYYSSYSGYTLSTISSINLTWTGHPIPPPPKNDFNPRDSRTPAYFPTLMGALMGIVLGTPIILVCYIQCCLRRNEQAASTTTVSRNVTTESMTSTVVPVAGGLDQVNIDSYPVVVLGESGSLLNSDDNTCSICLSDYQPLETLKLLPQCLHRFHKDCIHQWLRSKGVCPICRTFPPLTSSHQQFL
ncbi:hypothetical protein RND81_14G101200 [Saponaria officinalis]|uniref:RING-type E3 ubiquitin transferase n=1 Tax=Saponaria officinalis TaxID=3572 RepID=A0AAW1GQS5_SAPOF